MPKNLEKATKMESKDGLFSPLNAIIASFVCGLLAH